MSHLIPCLLKTLSVVKVLTINYKLHEFSASVQKTRNSIQERVQTTTQYFVNIRLTNNRPKKTNRLEERSVIAAPNFKNLQQCF